MAIKADLKDWVLESVKSLGGAASVLEVSRHLWLEHRAELEASGDLFFTWQYDIRWAAQSLRNEGKLQATVRGQKSLWALSIAELR